MPGEIVTFYSYKGGTGRSMALANVAWILAANNKKVLTIDWDFEAPGLHRYFLPFLKDTELEETKGLIDLLWDYVDLALMDRSEWPIGVNDPADIADAQRYAVPLEFPFESSQGCLHFLCAGLQDAKYGKKVRDFDWTAFYERLGGGQFLDELRKRLKEQYDYILIDSRTGVADTSGICTIHMPDTVVLCFTYNIQSVKGIASVAESINKQRPDEILFILVPMRVPLGIEGLEEARNFARVTLSKFLPKKMEPSVQEYWEKSESAFRGEYAFHEVLAVFKDAIEGRGTLLADMEWLAGKIVGNDSLIRMGQLEEWQRKRYVLTLPGKPAVRTPLFTAMPKGELAQYPPSHIRIFISGSNDVMDERALALWVLEELQYDPLLRGRITIETVVWDKPGVGTPMLATLTPQEAIKKGLPTPAECDIVIVIFWSRMGTPLPTDWKKPDGSRYMSGTEWEYLNALEAAERQGKPEILMYRRTEKIVLDPDDPAFDEKSRQWRLVQQFFQSFENPDGSLQRGYNPYPAPDAFREQLNLHLRALVRELLERKAPVTAVQPVTPAPPAAGPPLWSGSPFPGLRAFTPADAPIFFGRGRETDGLVSRLDNPTVRFLTVVGASSSGKSSLVAAGLIPRLMAGAIAGSQDWVWVRFTPGEVGDNPFMALAIPFKDLLQPHGQQLREQADRLEKNPATLVELRNLALAGKPDWAELLLFIDQFEELFTLAAPRHIGPFVEWLRQAAQTERIRVVATLRADFYHRCVEWPVLAELLRTGSYPLAAPGPGALHEMITRPAERAGLSFETGLAERILDDTGAGPGALALLAFALAELYHARTAEGHLTWAAYEGFNGVQGALAKRAEDTVNQLGVTSKTIGDVFQELVEIEEGSAVTRRRAPWVRLVQSAEAKRLVQAFIDARLLVASQGEDGQPVVEVAHEALFTVWKMLRDWIETYRNQLEAGQDLEEAAQEWQALSKRWSGLASGARLKRYRRAINPSTLASRFLRASARRLWIQWSLAAFAASLVVVAFFGAVWLYANGLTVKHGTSVLLAAVGLYHVNEPEMILIPAGEFWMGSGDDNKEAFYTEKPRHKVTIAKPSAIGKYEVTFEEYDQFAYATGRPLPGDQGWGRGRRPVINVSWEDAVAYAKWLSNMTGKPYRLSSEAEWEYAARSGSEASRFWGDDPKQACQYANVADQSYRQAGYSGDIFDCNDGHPFTAEIGSFKSNGFGLYDTLGNVWEFVQDSWHDSYKGAPMDGSAWEGGESDFRVVRGGSWSSGPQEVRAAARNKVLPRNQASYLGFRLAMNLSR